MILDGAVIAQQNFTGDVSDPRAYLLAFYPQATIPPLTHLVSTAAPLTHLVSTAAPLVARVNNGIWIASCSCGAKGLPAPGCVVFLDHLAGWCVRCGNQAWGHGWRPVIVPPPAERRRIEAVLLSRPNVADRNWEPGESLNDLLVQNAEHGDPVPHIDALLPPLQTAVPSGPRWPTEAGRAILRALRRKPRRWGG